MCESACKVLRCGMVGEDKDENDGEEDEEGKGEEDEEGEGTDEFDVGGIGSDGHKGGEV